ncbi:uncharacterized protein IL334_007642 [Kwoniella shivajii]|uniref:PH domain-containing protein n=1 Tax=Kwoniella shivajii TaxID=564305 RepID=A0ABZ1D986_9TREE|nr:hypothetical protein IL334_007642 [Kwoniella shivajii]
MPSPPLSPLPRRWRSSPDQPHPDFAALLSTFENTQNQPCTPTSPHSDQGNNSTSNGNGSQPEWATPRGISESDKENENENNEEEDENQVENLIRSNNDYGLNSNSSATPEIRTISPSPRRPDRTSETATRSESPLLPPNRGTFFNEDFTRSDNNTLGMGLGPRGIFSNEYRSPPSFTTIPQIPPQTTGQSTATIDAAYDGVLSQLDALANPVRNLDTSVSSSHTNPYLPQTTFHPMPIRQPLVGLGINVNSSLSQPHPTSPGLGLGLGNLNVSRLSTVTERTEKSSSPTSSQGRSPTFPGAYKEGPTFPSSLPSNIANKYPLPPSPTKLPTSPVKGPRSTFSSSGNREDKDSANSTPQNQSTPKKTSDLIKMFESRTDLPQLPLSSQPKFVPTPPTKSNPSKSSVRKTPPPISGLPNPPPTSSSDTAFNRTNTLPPSSFRAPVQASAPTPPPKSPSPLSKVRGMIASWRVRSGSPVQNVLSSPGKEGPGLFRGGDKGWNVSIRRRKRHETDLAEQADDHQSQERDKRPPSHHSETREDPIKSEGDDDLQPPNRSASIKSDKKTSEPKQLTGDPIRTGALYYLNVHDEDAKPNYQWVQADGRLYQEGLELTWISNKGRATVTLDSEFCDEVASTYSPNNPMAGDDIGAAAARRQGVLADNLYPFKLVYDDGVERLACESARERVRWVNAIWTVLERTRAAPSASLRANRSSSDQGSEGGGSASTHFTPVDYPTSPLPSGFGSYPMYTTDDAVIETSGGLHAPIVQRGSRRLAVAGLERARSLRRVASEADLREVSAPPLEKDVALPMRTTAIQDIPLTAQTAERPTSRDFTFAHGIKPPALKSEFSPSDAPSTFHTPATGFQSLTGTSAYSTADATPRSNFQPLSHLSRYTVARTEVNISTNSGQAHSTYSSARSGMAPPPVTTDQPLSSYTAPSVSTSASYQSARENSTTQSTYTAPTLATDPRGITEQAWTAHHEAFTPAGTAIHTLSSPSMYTAHPGTQTPLTTAQQWTSASAHTARQSLSEKATANLVSPSASNYTARPGSQTPATTVRGDMSTPSDHTAFGGANNSTSMWTAQPSPSHSDRATVLPPASSSNMATPQNFETDHPIQTATTPMVTVQPWTPSALAHTFERLSPSISVPMTVDDMPQVAVTAAPQSATISEDGRTPYDTVLETITTGLTAPTQPYGTARSGTQGYQTAGESTVSTASGLLRSPFHTPPPGDRTSSRMSRSTVTSYQTAPPPVPSRDSHYSTASPGLSTVKATSPIPSPTRFSLHDEPVPSYDESVKTPSAYPITTGGDSYFTAQHPMSTTPHGATENAETEQSLYHDRPPTTRYATATTDHRLTGSLGTAPTTPSRSPRSSEYNTAPPPPVSRSGSSEGPSSTRLTDGLTSRRGSRAWTQVSYPDSDDELLADLERNSSNGSSVSKRSKSKATTAYTPSRTMATARTFGQSSRAPLGTARDNTMYASAQESVYATAPSWYTRETSYVTAAQPPSSLTSRITPIRGEEAPIVPLQLSERPVESVSTASTIPSRRIPRRPPPALEIPMPAPPPQAPLPPVYRPPVVHQAPPPSPSFPSSNPPSSDTSSTEVPSSSAPTMDQATGSDVNRLLNFLQGQDQARQGQSTRVGNQLDRIERRVNQIAENQSALAERDGPPPVPSKDEDDESPPSSPSSTSTTSSASTARPVTPPPMIIPEVINQQFDDLRNLLGTLIGRQEDLLGRQDLMAEEMSRRRSFDVELPERGPGMARLEDLLRRVLDRVGDSEFDESLQPAFEETKKYPKSHLSTPKTQGTREGSMYGGGDSVYGSEFGARGRNAPANSISSEVDRRRRRPMSDISSSLLEGEIPEPEFDEEFALSGLPPNTPPREFVSRGPQFPRHLVGQRPRQPPQQAQPQFVPQPMSVHEEYPEEEDYYEDEPEQDGESEEQYEPEPELETEYEPTPPPVEKDITPEQSPDQAPIPYRTESNDQDENVPYENEDTQRGPYRSGPAPQPVDLPTPVNSPRNMPQYQGQPGMRPGFAPAPGMPAPMGPGMTDMPRPSLPRIAGVRDPISTTYFRRGFPPGPMGPMGMGMGMGMFPGPMGIPGPGMGPFMPGLRPGMPGFGGPIGPNVNPSLRRPGFFPPGVTSTTGDYGLPAAARYGNAGLPPSGPTTMGVPRPSYGNTTTADTGLGNTTTESTVTTPSVTTEEIVTPVAPTTMLHEPIEIYTEGFTTAALPPIPLSASHVGADDSFRRTLDNTQNLAAAQGEQQNEMSRYLHGMSDQIADGTHATQNQLAEILGDIAALRQQVKPKRIHAHVLPDGTVVLDNGDILDGIRGAPAPVPLGAPARPPPPPTASHVEGKILPDGTVMAGGKIVDGIKAAPTVPATPMMELDEAVEETVKDIQQDLKLAELQEKIEELMAQNVPPLPAISVVPPPAAERIFEEEEIISMRADSGSGTPGITPAPIPTTLGEMTPIPTSLPPLTGVAPTVIGPNTDVRREKQVIKEREVIREGPIGRHKEVTIVDELEKDMVTTLPPGSVVPPGTVFAEEDVAVTAAPSAGPGGIPVAAASGKSQLPEMDSVPTAVSITAATGTAIPPPTASASARTNPRTGKPLTMPPLLSAHTMSPIPTEHNFSDTPVNHLIREEHEEIIQRPDGGPPIHTHTTSRTYTQVPAGTGQPGTVMGDAPVSAIPVSPIPHTLGPSASAGHAPTTVGPIPVTSHANIPPAPTSVVPSSLDVPVMPTIAPGAHTSDHQSVVQQAPPNVPTVKSTHEAEIVAPGPVPIDSKNASTSHTVHPGATVADPSVVAPSAAVPTGPIPPAQTASNVPSAKPVWDTNHPESPKASKTSSLANVPTDKPASVMNVPTTPSSVNPPGTAHNVASMVSEPAPVMPDAGVHVTPTDSADGPIAAPPASSGGKNGVHWDPRIPEKEVLVTPPKSPKSSKSKPSSVVEAAPANIPSHLQASEIHNVPTEAEAGLPIHPIPSGGDVPMVLPGSNEAKAQDTPKTPSSGGGILRKPKSKESLKETTPGVPLVPADTHSHADHTTFGKPIPTQGSDKSTRVSDTSHVSRPPTLEELAMEGRDLTIDRNGETVHVPVHPVSASGSNKLKKEPPTFVEGSTADPAHLANNVPLENGLPSRAGTPAPSTKAAPGEALMVLEPVVLPDGQIAYIPSRPASHVGGPKESALADGSAPPSLGDRPSTGKKGKSSGGGEEKDKTASIQKDTTHTGIPAESEVGRGHCSVCCPNGPRAVGGVPIEPCEHQDGILGQAGKQHIPSTAPTGPRSNKSGKLNKPPPAGSLGLPTEDVIGGPGEEVNIGDVAGDVFVGDRPKSGPPSKLSKGKKSTTPEEEAMEDARKLAQKQKAAAEQAALEAAERDAKLKEKEDNAKLAEERHRQNVEALANLQKALDLIATDGKVSKTMNDERSKAQDKRRTDKSVRDKKITEALDKLVADREEEKKKQVANDKKPGTQAVLDALKTHGDGQSAFLRKLATEIMEQNSNQHNLTQAAAKAAAREQIGFNLAGYLDDFSKALSGEVRVLLKEVGDLRESRRALYMELAELLLMKGRQSAGDLMAVMPYPANPPGNPANQPKKDNNQNPQGQKQEGQGKGKSPAGVPAWAQWHPMVPPVMGRPLPQTGGPPPMMMNLGGGAVPGPPPPSGRPLPKV